MPLPKVHRVVQDSLGNVVPQVLCSVLNEGTGVLATLWQDDAGTIPLSNPMTSDATYGSFGFYVNPGHYDLTFVKPGYTFQPQMDVQVPQDDLTLGTMAQQDAHAVAITGGSAALNTLTVTAGVVLPTYSGSNKAALFSDMAGAGDATRYFINHTGTAQTRLGGLVGIQRVPAAFAGLSLAHLRASGAYACIITPDADTGNAALVFYNAAGTIVGTIATTAAATAYNTSSDARLKHAITALTGALDVVAALRPVQFRWRSDDSEGRGFLAHEVAELVPEAITGEQDAVDAEGNVQPQQIDHSKLVPWLTAGMQELLSRVDVLQAQVLALQARLA